MNENNGQFNGSNQDAQQGTYVPPGPQGPYAQGDPGQYGQGAPGPGYYGPPGGFAPPPPHFAPKQRLTADKKDLLFAPVLLILCGVGVFAGLWGGFRAGYTVAFDLLFIAVSAYLAKKGTAPGFYGLLCGVLSLALSGVFVTTSNEIVRTGSVIAMVCTSAVWFSALAGKRLTGGELSLIPHIAVPVAESVGEMPGAMHALFSAKSGGKRAVPKAVLGALCAIPVLCVVVPLLARSDLAFEGMVQGVIKSVGSVLLRIFVTLLLAPFVIAFAFALRKKERPAAAQKAHRGIDTSFLAAFTGVLCVCYLVYLFSQLAYFISAFSGFLPTGYEFSYSEYARRGFFELCAIAGINLAVLYLMILLSQKNGEKLPGVLRGTGAFLGVFTLFLIATAVSKNVMYIREYGMTVLRVGSSAFMIALAAVFLAAILRCFITKVRVLPAALAAFACALCVLGLCNINGICARYNYESYKNGSIGRIDAEYLYELGAEGVPYLVKLAAEDNEDARRELYQALQNYYDGSWPGLYGEGGYAYFKPEKRAYPALSQYSIPLARAYAAMEPFLQEYPDFTRQAVLEGASSFEDF